MQNRLSNPLWPLALSVALLPPIAAHLALWLSAHAGYVPDCFPYWDGGTSVSRAARHGLGNSLFKLLMLPCAVLQWLHWCATRQWLRISHSDPGAGRSLMVLGAVAGAALAVYVAFLGTDGEIYRWLRRYGIVFYFAATYFAQLLTLRRLVEIPALGAALPRGMLLLCLTMLGVGLASVASSALVVDDLLKDRLENALEWNLGIMFSFWFLAQAWLWRRTDFRLQTLRL